MVVIHATGREASSLCCVIGIALFAFATLKLEATWCCEQMQPGSLDALEERRAGSVADTLTQVAQGLPSSGGRDGLVSASQRFQSLVKVRNSLFYARPKARWRH